MSFHRTSNNTRISRVKVHYSKVDDVKQGKDTINRWEHRLILLTKKLFLLLAFVVLSQEPGRGRDVTNQPYQQ